MNLNPFKHFIKSKENKSAYIIGSSFPRRIKDTFLFFNGSLFTEPNSIDSNWGILDYIIPPLPRILELLPQISNKNGWLNSRNAFYAYASLINLVSIPKFIVAALLTVLSMPIIPLVHRFAKSIIDKSNPEIEKLQIIPAENGMINKDAKPILLRTLLSNSNLDINKLLVQPGVVVYDVQYNEYDKLQYYRTDKFPPVPYLGMTAPYAEYRFDARYLGLYSINKPHDELNEFGNLEKLGVTSNMELIGIFPLYSNNGPLQAMQRINKFGAAVTLAGIQPEINKIKYTADKKEGKHVFLNGTSSSPSNKSPVKILRQGDMKNTLNLILGFSGHVTTAQPRTNIENVRDSKDNIQESQVNLTMRTL